jgi:hypothetical protein
MNIDGKTMGLIVTDLDGTVAMNVNTRLWLECGDGHRFAKGRSKFFWIYFNVVGFN